MTEAVMMRPRVYVKLAWLREELGPDAPIYEGPLWHDSPFSPNKNLQPHRRCKAFCWDVHRKAYEQCRKAGRQGHRLCLQHERMWDGKFSKGHPRTPA